MGGFENVFTTFQTQLIGLAAPFAIIGIIAFILAFFISPLLPDVMGPMRGYIQKALIGVAFISFIPGIVNALAALGGGG